MQELINALTNGTNEVDGNGNTVNRPPTSLMLRAARAIKQMAEQLQQAAVSIESLQRQYLTEHTTIEAMTNQLYSLRKENESLRESQPKVSDVGNSGPDNSGIDGRSEADSGTEDHSSGTN